MKKCVGKGQLLLLPALFPICGTFSLGLTSTCLEHKVECRFCEWANAVNGLNRDCDLFDDGLANASCGALPIPTSVTANGLSWYWNDVACGESCNDVCAAFGLTPVADETWLAAQDSVAECQAISQAFGLGATVEFGNFGLSCLADDPVHSLGDRIIIPPLRCSSAPSCPVFARENVAFFSSCGSPGGSQRFICPCE